MAKHAKFVSAWVEAMRYGILTGRPYSESCIRLYRYEVEVFLKKFHEVSIPNYKLGLKDISIEQFSKRRALFEALNCFAKFLIQEGEMPDGFLSKMKEFRPKRHMPPKKISVDQSQLDKLMAVCEKPLDKLLIVLLSQTGLRASEAAALKVEDINFEKRFLLVRKAKWGKSRRVGLTQQALDAILEYLDVRKDKDFPGLMKKDSGIQMDRGGILTRIYKLGRKAGVEVSPHALRRAFVTINANKGRPLVMLQMACGHSDITTTRSYCMTTEDEAIEAMQGWD